MVAIVSFLGAIGAVLFLLWVGFYLLKKNQKKKNKKYLQINVFSLLATTSEKYSFINLIEKFNVRPYEMKDAINALQSKDLIEKSDEKYSISKFGDSLYNGFLKGKEDGIESFL